MQTYLAITSLALAGFSYGSPISVVSGRGFMSGGCNVHVTQWQKNENGVGGAYQFDVRITDAIGKLLGGANRLTIGDFQSEDVTSDLPYLVVISAGAVDGDPVQFAYAGSHFSSSHGCSTGGYEDGNRDMDCNFSC